MTHSSPSELTAGHVQLLGDLRGLAAQVGDADMAVVASGPLLTRAQLLRLRDEHLVPNEWPVILESAELTRAGHARELIALDARWTARWKDAPFAGASRAVGRRQLSRLRGLRDHRVVQRYLAAVEAGDAAGWHVCVYGVVLGTYSLPLRQGLMNYAVESLRSLASRVTPALPAAATDPFIGELEAPLASALDGLIDASGVAVRDWKAGASRG
jgi:urease accessory protein UreF